MERTGSRSADGSRQAHPAPVDRPGPIPELVQVPTTGADPVVIARGEPADPSSAEALRLWSAAWSPDGEQLAYVSNVTGSGGPDGSPSSGVFVMDADDTDARLVGTLADGTTQGLVRWSVDSQRLLVRVLSADSTAFVLQPIDGSPWTEVARLGGRSSWHVAWSPDETKLVAARQHEPARIMDLASGDVVLQSWMSAYDLAWQPIPPPAE